MRSRVGRSRLRILLLAVVCAIAVSAVGAGSASATQQDYAWGYYTAGSGQTGPRHTLISNIAAEPSGGASPRVCAGQHDANGYWTGSYVCGYGGAIHNYCHCALYYPKAHNGDGYTFYMGGRSEW